MNKGLSSPSGRLPAILLVIGWVVLLGLGHCAGILWLLPQDRSGARANGHPNTHSRWAHSDAAGAGDRSPYGNAHPPDRHAAARANGHPAHPTPAAAKVTVTDQINVRSGPGTEYTLLGTLGGGSEAPVIGRSGGWWQITYNGAPAWVFGEIVTAANTDGVPEVQAPPRPTAAPTAIPAPTAVPPTATPSSGAAPASETRGIVVNSYRVEGAPGPYGAGAPDLVQHRPHEFDQRRDPVRGARHLGGGDGAVPEELLRDAAQLPILHARSALPAPRPHHHPLRPAPTGCGWPFSSRTARGCGCTAPSR